MSKIIRIDDDVFKVLQKASVKYGMELSTPNKVLRRILTIDTLEIDTLSFDEVELKNFKTRNRRISSSMLYMNHKNLPDCKSTYMNRNGLQYPFPQSFSTIFFDQWGLSVHS